MKLYLIIIGICTAIIATLTSVFSDAIGFSVLYAILGTVFSVIGCIAIDAIVASIVRMFPRKFYDPYKRVFQSKSWENRFYKKIRVHHWKDKIPETGKLLVKFGKSKIENKSDPTYLYKFLTELGYAEIMHLISTVAGFLVVFFLPLKYALFIGLPVGFVNFCLQIPPILVQRYNRPRLLRLYERVIKRAAESYDGEKVTKEDQTTVV